MAQLFAVAKRLKDKDWEPFHAMLRRRDTTIKIAHAWILERGYHISRGAVWQYMKALANRPIGMQVLSDAGPQECRRQIARDCHRLNDQELAAVSMFVAFLVNLKTRPKKRSQKLAGPADLGSVRTASKPA
jgi:hypothetical protein